MNQTFDTKRFCQYFMYFLKTGVRKHLAIVGALLGFTLLIILVPDLLFDSGKYMYKINPDGWIKKWGDPMWETEFIVFLGMMWVTMVVSASMMFSDFGEKGPRLNALMLPASALEKYLTRWIVYVPLTAVVLLAGYEVIDLVRCFLLTLKYGASAPVYPLGLTLFAGNFLFAGEALSCLSLAVAFYALGAIVWPRFSLVKTFAVQILLMVVYAWFAVIAVREFDNGCPYHMTQPGLFQSITITVLLLLSLVMYVIAYYRLKETELVQRW